MKRKRTLLKEIGTKIIYDNNTIIISREGNEWFFEIGKELTTDLGEAVSLLLRNCDANDPIWQLETRDIDTDNVSPEKSLYWLSGGEREWKTLEHYNRPWCDCYLEFQEEFGFLVISIINRSRTLEEMRKHFIEYLNLPVLYDFALSRKLLR
jgi:hypothetical protein